MFSINAIGKIDNKLIYRKRKKFDDVKKYIKTVNPDLPGQKIQKGYFKGAILDWQIDGYTDKDIQAWNLYARAIKKAASGFNMFTRFRINAEKEGKIWKKLTDCNIYDVKGWGFKVDINVESDFSGILYLGTSKFSMLKVFEGTFSVNKYTFTVTGLSELTKYFFYIKNTSRGKDGRTGIYCKQTGIGKLIVIDIGCPAIDRPYYLTGPRTAINIGNPANATGIIDTIEIYAVVDITDCKVATFFVVSGNKLSTRDYEEIGTVTAGVKQTFEVNLNVQEGDYLGIFYIGGQLEKDTHEMDGVWWTSSDQIPCYKYEFSLGEYWAISLYGKGSEVGF